MGVREGGALPGYSDLAVLSLLVAVSLPFVAFQVNPHAFGETLNLYTRLLGYVLGFLVTYSYSEFTTWIERLSPSVFAPIKNTSLKQSRER